MTGSHRTVACSRGTMMSRGHGAVDELAAPLRWGA